MLSSVNSYWIGQGCKPEELNLSLRTEAVDIVYKSMDIVRGAAYAEKH